MKVMKMSGDCLRNPFSDLCLAVVTDGAFDEEFLKVLRTGFVKTEPLLSVDGIGANAPDLRLKFLHYGYVVLRDNQANANDLLFAVMACGCIPLVNWKVDAISDFPCELEWNDPSEIVKKVADLRKSPELFCDMREHCHGVGLKLAESVNPALLEPSCFAERATDQEDHLPFDEMLKIAEGVPVSNGCRYYERHKVKVGIVCDEFFWDSMKDAAEFVYIAPGSDWRSLLKNCDFLLVVSTWKGLHNEEWKGVSTKNSPNNLLLYQIIARAKEIGIKAVFYSKEDPPNYKVFIPIAQVCDYVFTSAEEMIPHYKEDCGHDRVFPFTFCINPAFHNPVGSRHHKLPNSVVFSGSWMMKYPRRCRDLGVIFKGAMMAGKNLCIIDRNYERRTDWHYRYPEVFRRRVNPALNHGLLQKVHKLFDWAININSVQQSRTMFANRAYELQASGNLLLSNYSLGVTENFPTVFTVQQDSDVAEIMDNFSEDEIIERQTSGVRRVMTGETCYDRLAYMFDMLGIKAQVAERSVLVVAEVISDRIRQSFEVQSYRKKTLMRQADITESVWVAHDIVAFMDEKGDYDPFYLEDMINAFKYTDCNYITKASYYDGGALVSGAEHDFVSRMEDKCRSVFWRTSYSMWELLNLKNGVHLSNGYSTDRLGYGVNKVKISRLPDGAMLSVIVPVYNNGWQLYGRAMAALRRNALFDRMEIVLVDGGSTDGHARQMIRHLSEVYPNVRTVYGTSSEKESQAQSLMKGLEVASGEIIAFLTPDFMPTREGYEVLLTEMNNGRNFDFVLGNLLRMGYETAMVDFNGKIISAIGTGAAATTKCKDILAKLGSEFLDVRTMLLRKSFLAARNLDKIADEPDLESAYARKIFGLGRKMETVPHDIVGEFY